MEKVTILNFKRLKLPHTSATVLWYGYPVSPLSSEAKRELRKAPKHACSFVRHTLTKHLCIKFAYNFSELPSPPLFILYSPFLFICCVYIIWRAFMRQVRRLLIPKSSFSSICLEIVECLLAFMGRSVHSSTRTVTFIACSVYCTFSGEFYWAGWDYAYGPGFPSKSKNYELVNSCAKAKPSKTETYLSLWLPHRLKNTQLQNLSAMRS